MEVDAISLKDRDSGNLFWGRNVGTAGHVATQDGSRRTSSKHGLQNIHRHAVRPAAALDAEAWEISFTGGGKHLQAASRPGPRLAPHRHRRADSSSTSSGSAAAPPPTSSAATSRARRC